LAEVLGHLRSHPKFGCRATIHAKLLSEFQNPIALRLRETCEPFFIGGISVFHQQPLAKLALHGV
jgi:hypothetical protein